MTRIEYSDFDESAQHTMRLAHQLAQKDEWGHITVEHLLGALCQNQGSPIGAIFEHFGVSPTTVFGNLRLSVRSVPKPVASDFRSNSQGFMRAVDQALKIRADLSAKVVADEHLLLGILVDQNSSAFKVLENFGMRFDSVFALLETS